MSAAQDLANELAARDGEHSDIGQSVALAPKTSLLIIATGVVVQPMTTEEASSVTTRISVKLDAVADNYDSAIGMIRDAITRRAHLALGYKSPGAYVADRFGHALSRLSPDLRRQVVLELTAAGLSTRAIAPVFGVSQKTIVKDRQVIPQVSPGNDDGDVVDAEVVEDDVDRPLTQAECEALDADSRANEPQPEPEPAAPPVTGLDGKTYTKPKTQPKARQKALTDDFRSAWLQLDTAVKRVTKLSEDRRFNDNADQIGRSYRSDLARARDALQCVIDQLPNYTPGV